MFGLRGYVYGMYYWIYAGCGLRLLFVTFTIREPHIRIIHAHVAEPDEEQLYEEKKTTNPVPPEFKLSPKARVVPKSERHEVSAEAMEPRNTKVRVSIYLDLDVLNFFKALAEKPGALPYQTQVNAALRDIVEKETASAGDAASHLRQAKSLIDAALRKIG